MRREPGLERGSMPVRLLRSVADTARNTHTHAQTPLGGPQRTGLWPMVRPGAVSDATRALRCLWLEIRVDERTNR
eukprot:2952794-Prymnesium_polylepis.1